MTIPPFVPIGWARTRGKFYFLQFLEIVMEENGWFCARFARFDVAEYQACHLNHLNASQPSGRVAIRTVHDFWKSLQTKMDGLVWDLLDFMLLSVERDEEALRTRCFGLDRSQFVLFAISRNCHGRRCGLSHWMCLG